MRYLMSFEGRAESVLVRHVALDKHHLRYLILVENELQAMQIFLQIVDENLIALEQQVAGDADADAAVAAGEKNTHGMASGYAGAGSINTPGAPSLAPWHGVRSWKTSRICSIFSSATSLFPVRPTARPVR